MMENKSDHMILLDNEISDENDSEIELGYNNGTNNNKYNNNDNISYEITKLHNEHHKPFLNNVRAAAWRLRQSVSFFILYLALIILNAIVLVLELTSGKTRGLCIILEGVITILFVCEVIVQMITEECHVYWISWLNRIDFIVCILCVILFVLWASFEEAPHSHHLIDSFMDAILVGIRYGLQAIRLLRFAHKGHENKKMLDNETVEFKDDITNTVLEQSGIKIKRNYNNNFVNKIKGKFSKNYQNGIELAPINQHNDSESNEYDSNEDYDLNENNNDSNGNHINSITNDDENGENIKNISDIDSPIIPNKNDIYSKKSKNIDVKDYKLNNIDIDFDLNIIQENFENNNNSNNNKLNNKYTQNDTIKQRKNIDRIEQLIDNERMDIYNKISNENVVYSSAN